MVLVDRLAVDHHGNCHAAHSHHMVADCLVAKHDNVAVVDNYDFPSDFESKKLKS